MRGSRTIACSLTLTIVAILPTFADAQVKPLRQLIDQEIKEGWQQDNLAPPSRAPDTVFLRRVYLDLVGVTPSYEETTSFLKDTDPRKREKIIDKLLSDPRYGPQQGHVWDLVLFGRNPQNIAETRKRDGFKKWLSEQFAKNEPYDKIVRN